MINLGFTSAHQNMECMYVKVFNEKDQDDMKRTIRYLFMTGTTSISWSSNNYRLIALSSCMTQYVVTFYVAFQSLWIVMRLKELKFSKILNIKLLVSKKSTIDLTNHPLNHGRSKHIKIK